MAKKTSHYMVKKIAGFVLPAISIFLLFGFKSDEPKTAKKVSITRTNEPIKIDGKLDENIWQSLSDIGPFVNHWPIDTGLAPLQTDVKLAHDNDYFYVAAKCYTTAKPIIKTLKRDTDPYGSEAFFVILEPFNQHVSGYLFGVNAGGAETDGIIEVNDATTDWNARWLSKVTVQPDFYIVEIAIPFSVIKFPPNSTQWSINFNRSDMHNNVYSTWSRVPIQFSSVNLNYNLNLEWGDAPKISHRKNVFQPYFTGSANKTYQPSTDELKPKVGADAKIALNSSLNLDITANPDFSQIEVDQQILNLDRFNPLLPERRTFFLENNDLFYNFGLGNIRPFTSRKIGLTPDGRTKTILGGARLTGNLNEKLRIGVMGVQTDHFENKNQQNYFVGVFEQRVLKRSNVKGIITNRVGFNRGGGINYDDFNRLAGLEFNYYSEDNLHEAAARFHYVFNSFSNDRGQLALLHYAYKGRIWNTNFWYIDMGDYFNPEMGFSPYNVYFDVDANKIQRKGYRQLWNKTTRYFYFKRGSINAISIAAETYINLFSDGILWEARNQLTGTMDFKNTSGIKAFANHFVTRLRYATKFAGEKINPGIYHFKVYHAEYKTDTRKNINLNVSAEAGDYFGGYRHTYGGGITIRKQPLLNIDLGVNLSEIQLNNKNIDLALLNSKVELNFSKNLFWTTFLQYNTQSKNFNINSRFQWRFRPMSDLFLVYTDNYDTDLFEVKNRSIALKLNYWLNW